MSGAADAPSCGGWDSTDCRGSDRCPRRCPRFVDKRGSPVVFSPYAGEFDALLGLYGAFDAGDRTLGLPPVGREATVEWLRSLLASGWNLLAHDGDVVGHAAATPREADAPELVIFVRPSPQGRGVGSELLRQLVARLALATVEAVRLSVDHRNRTAVAVYRSVGFEVVEDGPIVEMRLDLPEARSPASPAAVG